MKKRTLLYRLICLACSAVQIAAVIGWVILCWKMSGGYTGGWSAGYCLPRLAALAAASMAAEWLKDDAYEALCKKQEAAHKEIVYSGLYNKSNTGRGA